ncbi:MAG: 16S rRNA (cytosine(1402)-N(4))-methyltransferase RsmH [Candidatus Thermochlorobacter sp.]
MEFAHTPVLLSEAIDGLVTAAGIYIDGTLGGGGHSAELLRTLEAKNWLERSLVIGIDQDQLALEAAARRLLPHYAGACHIVEGNFAEMKDVLQRIVGEEAKVQGILLDLGVSSAQLDEAGRGFSFQKSALLDMRMSQRATLTAKDVVNSYDEATLAQVLHNYGEEKRARQIARRIAEARRTKPIETTGDLAALVRKCYLPHQTKEQIKSLARVFQAIRIEVNQELEALKMALVQAESLLASGGRLVVIAYHSLEDRLVKTFMREKAQDNWGGKGLPLKEPLRKATLRLITKKPITPSEDEIQRNPRARSAKLRIAEKI